MDPKDSQLIENTLPPQDEVDVDPENPDGELPPDDAEGDAEEQEPEADGFDVVIAGFEEDAPKDEEAGAPTWVKELRQRNREMARELKALKQERETQTKQVETITVGEKPTLAGCEFDDDKYEREYSAWVERKQKFDVAEREKKAAVENEQKAWQERLNQYDSEKKTLPVDDYEEAEATVQDAFSQTQVGILVKGAKRPAELVYALYKSPKALQTLAAMKDPVEFAVAIGEMMANTKATPRKSIPAPERIVRGGAGGKSPAMTSSNLDKLREEGLRKGDLSEYYRAKEKTRA